MKIGGRQVPNWAVYGGVGVLVVGGVLWYRNRSASTAAASTASTAASDPNLIDPTTGVPYADETAGNYAGYTQGISGYGYGFPTSDITGGTTVGTAYTSNAQWAQAVEAGLTAIGYDAQAVGAAVGKYLLNMPLTSDQVTIVQTAVAEFGPPPVGTFAIIASTSDQTGSGGGSGGTGGSGGSGGTGGTGGTGSGRLARPSGVHLTIDGRTGVRLQWGAVAGASGYVAQLHRGGNNGPVVSGPFGTSAPVANFGNLQPGTHYTALLWPSSAADPGGPGSDQPHTEFGFTTPK